MHRTLVLLLIAFLAGPVVAEDPLRVAVASNFGRTFEQLAVRFSEETGIVVDSATGSTGKLYAQIINGAPFDVFLAADADRPALLEASGRAVPGSRFTYATGRLVLWSRDADDCVEALHASTWVALANPDTAPYGRAARDFLQQANYWQDVSGRVAYAENVMQVLQFAASGNAGVGFVAESLLNSPYAPTGSCTWQVPPETHSPLEQQAVLLTSNGEDERAIRLFEFLQSDAAISIISKNGYGESR
ncbi:MAG: molybdate ABC transporter substrate-binding protein [Gammaproteobacteria bacterium]|nr:molybdate ABC transporter substrate-binding protein [Gammaproteobacteria bacterium]